MFVPDAGVARTENPRIGARGAPRPVETRGLNRHVGSWYNSVCTSCDRLTASKGSRFARTVRYVSSLRAVCALCASALRSARQVHGLWGLPRHACSPPVVGPSGRAVLILRWHVCARHPRRADRGTPGEASGWKRELTWRPGAVFRSGGAWPTHLCGSVGADGICRATSAYHAGTAAGRTPTLDGSGVLR